MRCGGTVGNSSACNDRPPLARELRGDVSNGMYSPVSLRDHDCE